MPDSSSRTTLAAPTQVAYPRSLEAFERACNVIPGGIHLSGRPLLPPGDAPLYFDRGEGCRIHDVDGNTYVDFFMGFGPFLLGYANAEVDAAACAQLRRGSLLSMNHPLHATFAERLVERFPSADMAVFFKTGSEATTAALRIARRATGRRKVIRAGYHGWHDWCLPLEDFVPAGLREEVLEFDPNVRGSLARALASAPGEIAAVIVAPEMVLPAEREVFVAMMEATRAAGALFVLDEVKTAFRITPGSVQQRFGIEPDLTPLSKALGNGWPVAALVGRRDVMVHGAGMHYSATFHGDTAAIAAALATMQILEREPVAEHVWRLGETIIEGLASIGARHEVPVEVFGEPFPPMPFMRFVHPDPGVNAEIRDRFFGGMYARGFLLHPRHMWFVSHAHDASDVEAMLVAADASMREASERL